ncbi:hypothetical protein PR202_ga23787 [Eleusine coracana subsp. coracana]|uniref:Uncharacterized protein n=1 Tax=Eleusine coracana subsp. coracana TaxID=191504 RepID=A0AAV5D793_ELECO|nr:hypothetical protein PR202_ga23787 [Eleusine coracana subsp. coracana]
MALLCFLLDLRNIPPPLLHRLKQCLLHLANLYAATTSPPHPASAAAAPALPDRLALVYVHHAASSDSSSSSSSSSSPEDAAEQCVAVDFVLLETEASFMYDGVSENVNCLENKICDLENCVVRRYSPESQVLHGLVKRWLEELKDDKEETLQAVLVFREPIINSVKHIYCNLYASTNQIIDAFPYCQVIKIDLLEVDLNYYMCGAVFYGLCRTLFELDQGLVCSSLCNTGTMGIGTLQCYYLLQPSERGPMLLRVANIPPVVL